MAGSSSLALQSADMRPRPGAHLTPKPARTTHRRSLDSLPPEIVRDIAELHCATTQDACNLLEVCFGKSVAIENVVRRRRLQRWDERVVNARSAVPRPTEAMDFAAREAVRQACAPRYTWPRASWLTSVHTDDCVRPTYNFWYMPSSSASSTEAAAVGGEEAAAAGVIAVLGIIVCVWAAFTLSRVAVRWRSDALQRSITGKSVAQGRLEAVQALESLGVQTELSEPERQAIASAEQAVLWAARGRMVAVVGTALAAAGLAAAAVATATVCWGGIGASIAVCAAAGLLYVGLTPHGVTPVMPLQDAQRILRQQSFHRQLDAIDAAVRAAGVLK